MSITGPGQQRSICRDKLHTFKMSFFSYYLVSTRGVEASIGELQKTHLGLYFWACVVICVVIKGHVFTAAISDL